MAELEHNENHVDEGLALLIMTFKGKPRIEAVLTSYLEQVQVLEDDFWEVFSNRWVDTATGIQLDRLGEIVGETRQSSSDDEYRAFIRARIRVNRSNGKMPELVSIVSLILDGGAVTAREYYPSSIVIGAYDALPVSARRVNRMLQRAKAGGVRIDLIYSKVDRTSTLTFGWSGGSLGLATGQKPGWSGDIPGDTGVFAGTMTKESV